MPSLPLTELNKSASYVVTYVAVVTGFQSFFQKLEVSRVAHIRRQVRVRSGGVVLYNLPSRMIARL